MPAFSSRVLLIYTDPYYLTKQVPPLGLDCLSQHLRRHGHETRLVHAFLPDPDPADSLGPVIREFQPEIIAFGLRNIDTCLACEAHGNLTGEGWRAWHFLDEVARAVRASARLAPEAALIVGGGAFSVAPEALLDRLGLDFGVVGPGEEPLRRFVEVWPDEDGLADIPGLVRREGEGFQHNPPWEMDFSVARQEDWDPGFAHAYEATALPVRLKRGCNQGCSYCVEPIIEGRRFVWRSEDEVVESLWRAAERFEQVRRVFFVDTEFNVPDASHGQALAKRLAAEGLDERFRFASQFLPRPFSRDFAEDLARAGFQVIFTADSCSDRVLERAGTSYRRADLERALELCAANGLETTVNLIFGLPGEDWESLEETAAFLDAHPPGPGLHYEYTVGGRLYQGTRLSREALTGGGRLWGKESPGLLEPLYFCSPVAPLELLEWLNERLPVRLTFGNAPDPEAREALSLRYLLDQGRAEEAARRFARASLGARARVFDPLFRGLAEAGLREEARQMALTLIGAVEAAPDPAPYLDAAGMAQFYLQFL